MNKFTAGFIVSITAILCITAIELYALHLNVNGVILAATVAIIAGIAGFEANTIVKIIKSKKPPE